MRSECAMRQNVMRQKRYQSPWHHYCMFPIQRARRKWKTGNKHNIRAKEKSTRVIALIIMTADLTLTLPVWASWRSWTRPWRGSELTPVSRLDNRAWAEVLPALRARVLRHWCARGRKNRSDHIPHSSSCPQTTLLNPRRSGAPCWSRRSGSVEWKSPSKRVYNE